jgi:hypothetical protein
LHFVQNAASEPKNHVRRKNLTLKAVFCLHNWQRKFVFDDLAVDLFFQLGAEEAREHSALAEYLFVHVDVVQINIDDGLKWDNSRCVLVIEKWLRLNFTSLARERSVRLFNLKNESDQFVVQLNFARES